MRRSLRIKGFTLIELPAARKRAFTLIELLIVIAIIAILATLIIVNVRSAQVKARDSKRMSDLAEMRKAIELYKLDNGFVPVIGRWSTSEVTTFDNGTHWSALQTALAPYMSQLPHDPLPKGTGGPWSTGNYHYAYSGGQSVVGDKSAYDLWAQLEEAGNKNTCEFACWKYHQGELPPYAAESVQCVSAACPAGNGMSLYLYADH